MRAYILLALLMVGLSSATVAGFSNVKNITIINNASSSMVNYVMFFNVSYEPEMNLNYSDVRFYYYNATTGNDTLLNYWIENYTASQLLAWVNVSYVGAYGTSILKMYYGNATLASGSNGTNTFLYFDDFNDNNVSDWVSLGFGNAGAANATIVSSNGTLVYYCTASCYNFFVYRQDFSSRENISVDLSFKKVSSSQGGPMLIYNTTPAGIFFEAHSGGTYQYIYRQDTKTTGAVINQTTTTAQASNIFQTMQLSRNNTHVWGWYNRTGYSFSNTTNYTSGIAGFEGWSTNKNYTVDDFRTRAIISPEPSFIMGNIAGTASLVMDSPYSRRYVEAFNISFYSNYPLTSCWFTINGTNNTLTGCNNASYTPSLDRGNYVFTLFTARTGALDNVSVNITWGTLEAPDALNQTIDLTMSVFQDVSGSKMFMGFLVLGIFAMILVLSGSDLSGIALVLFPLVMLLSISGYLPEGVYGFIWIAMGAVVIFLWKK